VSLLIVIFILILVAVVAWWLSGYDPKVTGENKSNDFIRRVLRCLVTAVFAAILFGIRPSGSGYGFIPILLIFPISIALVWCGCVSEWWSQTFQQLLFAGGKGEYDPNAEARELDRLAALLKKGHREEALRLAEKLMKSGDANVLVLETMLARAGLELKVPQATDPLAEVYRLRSEGKIAEAVTLLSAFVEQNPSNVQALLLLIRLFAQDLKQPDDAAEALRLLEKQPHVLAWQIDYARRSLHDWSQDKPVPPPAEPLPESIDELLAKGYSGTAIEILDKKIKETPGDFDLWMKLVEAHAVYFRDKYTAQKLVQKMERDRAFTGDQIQTAKTKLTGWIEAKAIRAES
jgi:hypothetical protein